MSVDRDDTPRDDVLRAAFAELRDAECAGAPTLACVLSRAPARRLARTPVVRHVLAVVALVLVTVVAARAWSVRHVGHRRLTVPPEVVAPVAWRSATDALLATPGHELLRRPPPLAASMLDVTNRGSPR